MPLLLCSPVCIHSLHLSIASAWLDRTPVRKSESPSDGFTTDHSRVSLHYASYKLCLAPTLGLTSPRRRILDFRRAFFPNGPKALSPGPQEVPSASRSPPAIH
ncbi:hypothetical protein DL93DRAFT_424787 [Clavulina sp. PMI_390]|nr:hypothetical protein DL93DRAFT_424787 [Clavulina sp. PMI_390]